MAQTSALIRDISLCLPLYYGEKKNVCMIALYVMVFRTLSELQLPLKDLQILIRSQGYIIAFTSLAAIVVTMIGIHFDILPCVLIEQFYSSK